MTLIQKFTKAFDQSKEGGLNKIVKFEHSGCIYGVQYTGDHRGDRVCVYRSFLGGYCGHTLISTRKFSKAIFEIMIDSQWHRYHKINEFINKSRSFRRLNYLVKPRVQWVCGKEFMIRKGIEYIPAKCLSWETKHRIFNGLI